MLIATSIRVSVVLLAALIFFGVKVATAQTNQESSKGIAVNAKVAQLLPNCFNMNSPEFCNEPVYSHIGRMLPLQYEFGDPELKSILPTALLSYSNPQGLSGVPGPCPIPAFRSWIKERATDNSSSVDGVIYRLPTSLNDCVGRMGRENNPNRYYMGFYRGRVIARIDLGRKSVSHNGKFAGAFFHSHSGWQTRFVSRRTDGVPTYVPALADIVRGIWRVAEQHGFQEMKSEDLPKRFIFATREATRHKE